MKILVTGGGGYIGAHTVVDLIENDYDVFSIDNMTRAYPSIFSGIAQTTGIEVLNHPDDLTDAASLHQVLNQHPTTEGVIHFAAYKWVHESVANPLLYYHNNIASLVNLLTAIKNRPTSKYEVFSSSCSVYGHVQTLPVTENTPFGEAESPYAYTKQVGERVITDLAKTHNNVQFVLLRYFNPVGAHPKAFIGEVQPKPENLVPYITQTAIGKRPTMQVFGTDYPTRDGSCLRDYIHVCDIAHAHTLALAYMAKKQNTQTNCEVFNLGSGQGVTVLEAIKAFEQSTNQKLNYTLGPRRPGDVAAIYANNQRATDLLGWQPKYNLFDMMQTAWNWELSLTKKLPN